MLHSCFWILFFTNYCWLNMTKAAWKCKIWCNSEPEGQLDPDWTQICTLGAWPNPKSGFNLGLFLRFHLDPKIGPIFWSYQPIFGPQGLTLILFGPSGSEIWLGLAHRVKNWVGMIKKSNQIQVQANNLEKIPNLNQLLGLGQAPRVQIWVQSGSCWPSGSEFHQILQFQAVLVIFNQQ